MFEHGHRNSALSIAQSWKGATFRSSPGLETVLARDVCAFQTTDWLKIPRAPPLLFVVYTFVLKAPARQAASPAAINHLDGELGAGGREGRNRSLNLHSSVVGFQGQDPK